MSTKQTDRCLAEPPADGPWGDCWCTLPTGHSGEHRCEPCTVRNDAPGWRTAPDWADVREAARKSGLTIELRFGRYKPGRYRHGMWTWRVETAAGDLVANYRGRALGNYIELVGEELVAGRNSACLIDPTPAEVLTAARLVGLGGDSDER
jgi:hypothetical protein